MNYPLDEGARTDARRVSTYLPVTTDVKRGLTFPRLPGCLGLGWTRDHEWVSIYIGHGGLMCADVQKKIKITRI